MVACARQSASRKSETSQAEIRRARSGEEGWFLGVADTNDVIQKIEKTLNNTHTTTQKLTNNSFRNTKKHPEEGGRGKIFNRSLFLSLYLLSTRAFFSSLFTARLHCCLGAWTRLRNWPWEGPPENK